MRKGKEEVSSENQKFSVHKLLGRSGVDRVACVGRAAKEIGSYVNVEAATSCAANDAGDRGVSSRKPWGDMAGPAIIAALATTEATAITGNPLLLRRWIWLPIL